jgi:uncharacterized protein with von Willebrand factor type A (vWA) domain
MQKPKPLSREELLPLLVTDADAFTVQRYLRHREVVPRLPELEEQGQGVLPGPEGVLADLYYSLWDPEPRVREKSEITPDRRYWRELLRQTLQSSAYEELHAATQLKELQSVLGTIAMGEQILALVPEEDKKQLQELAEAQRQADQLGQQAAEAQAQANAAQQLAQAAAGQPQPGQGQPGGQAQAQEGQPQGVPSGAAGQMTPEQAKALANELAKQAEAAKQAAESLQKQASEAQAKAEQLAEQLMGKPGSSEAQQKLDKLRRMGMAAVKQAQAKVEEVSETVQAWGLEPGELTRESVEEVFRILNAVKQNPALKKFAALLGRLRQIAARKARSKIAGEGVRITVTETGRDLKRLVPSELISLVHPALRVKALQRWTRGELRLHGQKARQKLGHGPVVVCEDASGSMDGVKQQWTKALVLALAHFTKIQRRSFGWILFDAMVHLAKVYPRGVLSAKDMLEIAESRAGGGTDFESPLRRAVEMIQKEGLKKADILLITDGMCAVSDSFLKELLEVKRALEVNIFTVLVNVGETTDKTVKEFSDRVIPISDLTAEEAERKVIEIL